MDRVTRYPIFAITDPSRFSGLAHDGDTSYTFKLVGVGPEAADWDKEDPPVWPADQEARLDALRTRVSYGQRAFSGQPPRWPPSPEDEEDEEVKAYRLEDSREAFPRQPRDLEGQRRAVIHSQAVRKSGTVATLRGAPDQMAPAPGRLLSESLGGTVVDSEQIDFLAARQQFLSLEQANTGSPPKPRPRVAPGGGPQGASQAPQAVSGSHLANGYAVVAGPQVREVTLIEKEVRGSPAGFGVHRVGERGPRPGGAESPEPAAEQETPIEREIRLAQEREADLRRQRGLQRTAGHQELVAIPTRPLLTTVSLTEVPRRDRGRPSLYVQRDIAQGTQREEDHRRQGLRAGRTATPDSDSEGPPPQLRRAFSSDSLLSPTPDARAADSAPEVRRVDRLPLSAYEPYQNPGSPRLEFSAFGAPSKPRGPSAEEVKAGASPKATRPQGRVLEPSTKSSSTKQELWKSPEKPPRASGGVVRWDYFHLRPLQFGVPDAPQQAKAPQVWEWEVAGAPPLRLQRSHSSDLLEREVASVLQREREVAEERRNALFPTVFTPPPESCNQESRSSSQASGITGSYSVSESPFFTPIRPHSGLANTVESEPEVPEAPPQAAPWQRKKKEMWYAGVSPSDDINLEIVEATRVTRHRSAMAERWEAGIYASEDED